MLFQEKLISKVDNYIESKTLPRTVMLVGPFGCGKHTLAKYIAEKLNFEFLDITSTLNLETLENITLSVTPRLYFIDGSTLSVKEQNIILKFLEEPLKNSYIVLTTESKNSLLETVVNRCVVLEFEMYTDEQLKQFASQIESVTEEVLKYADTPGRIMLFKEHKISEMEILATKILTQIKNANYSNILKIPSNINFKDSPELLNFDVFVFILINVASDLYKEQKIPFASFSATYQFYKDTFISYINKQHLFEHYLISLRRVLQGG